MSSALDLADAFCDNESPYSLYRSTYRATACGPSIGLLVRWIEYADNGEGGPHNPGDIERSRWFYCDELRKLGDSWYGLHERDYTVESISISSIVEGVDQCTDTIVIDVKDKTPSQIRTEYWAAVEVVNNDAQIIWNETHGCEECHNLHVSTDELEYEPGITPVHPECEQCQGNGIPI